jgi:hypothetical protein
MDLDIDGGRLHHSTFLFFRPRHIIDMNRRAFALDLLFFFGRLIVDLVPGGAKQFNQVVA